MQSDAPNPTGELMTQMTAQVFFVVAAADDTLLIPLAALNQQQGARSARPGDSPRPQTPVRNERAGRDAKRTVQVLREDGTIEQRTVRIGVTNRVSAEVVEGLQVGEQVVVGVRRAGSADPSSRSGRPLRLS